MSVEMDSSISVVEIFIPLLNEGTAVLRPTQGLVLGPSEVQVLATPDYEPTVEEWEFPPGTRVRCVTEIRGGRRLLVARQPCAHQVLANRFRNFHNKQDLVDEQKGMFFKTIM